MPMPSDRWPFSGAWTGSAQVELAVLAALLLGKVWPEDRPAEPSGAGLLETPPGVTSGIQSWARTLFELALQYGRFPDVGELLSSQLADDRAGRLYSVRAEWTREALVLAARDVATDFSGEGRFGLSLLRRLLDLLVRAGVRVVETGE